MKTTSFGHMQSLLSAQGEVVAEHLIFEREGRFHHHDTYETFVTLKGHGAVCVDESIFEVGPGDRVTIPPGSQHKMIPHSLQEPLEGLLWYHETAGQQFP